MVVGHLKLAVAMAISHVSHYSFPHHSKQIVYGNDYCYAKTIFQLLVNIYFLVSPGGLDPSIPILPEVGPPGNF